MRFLGMNDFAEIDRMTLYEYGLRMTAFRLRRADREYELHLQAWLNREIKAKKKSGKRKMVPVYGNFKQFFDYEKCINEILRPEEKSGMNTKGRGIFDLMKKQKERRERIGKL
jgi:hypothetical protein